MFVATICNLSLIISDALSAVYMIASSAYKVICTVGSTTHVIMSFIKILKSCGPIEDPCGTPVRMGCSLEVIPLNLVL